MERLSTLMTTTNTTKMDGAPVLTLPKDVNGGGDGGTKEGADANGDAARERHSKVITMVIEKFTKLQKECRYRRYKDLSAAFPDILRDLETFRDAEWPPKDVTPPEWLDWNDHRRARAKNADDDTSPEDDVDDDNVDDDGAETSETCSQITASVASESDAPPSSSTASKSAADESFVVDQDEDEDDDEAYDAAIPPRASAPCVVAAVESIVAVLAHPQRTARMAEIALNAVVLLADHSHVAGSVEGPPRREDALLKKLLAEVIRCGDDPVDAVRAAMTRAASSLVTGCGVHEASLLTCVRTVFHVWLVARACAKDAARAASLEMIRCVFRRAEAAPCGRTRTDAYLLFRALCRLSAKPLPGDEGGSGGGGTSGSVSGSSTSSSVTARLPGATLFGTALSVDPLALNSKRLSLQLILATFEHCGEVFRHGERFVYAVRNYLCVSLLKNCMSSHTEVAHASLKIFLALVYNFKAHLKSEIEVFVANIFLRVLESPNSSKEQKALVLEALRALCADPVLLTQIFLNYDCDFDAPDLYKSILLDLTKLCSVHAKDDPTPGLEVLVVILRAFLKAKGHPDHASVADDDKGDDDLRGAIRLEEEHVPTIAPDTNADDDDDAARAVVDAFDRKREAQNRLETGRVRFALSLKGGVRYLIDEGLVKPDAKSLALFFREHAERFDKTQIGECLGKEPEYALVKGEENAELGGAGYFVRVLHHYVETMDFTGTRFDDAVRTFLSGFRLPGEAQKIDRIMEKFAERYTRQNGDVFASADTAFILGFSVIMLNTDLHNPNIKPEKKLTADGFKKMNRGIDADGRDLPEEMLDGIFERVRDNPFTLKEDDDARAKAVKDSAGVFSSLSLTESPFAFDSTALFTNDEDRRKVRFQKEKDEIMSASEALFRARRRTRSDTKDDDDAPRRLEAVRPEDVVTPMFDVTWGPLLGTLSSVLETTRRPDAVRLCLDGFLYAVRLAARSGMSTARDTLVNSLARFTYLGSAKEMGDKNVEAIRTLLSLAITDGDYLEESWRPVLQCASQLGRLQLTASGLRSDDEFLRGGPADGDAAPMPRTPSSSSTSGRFFQTTPTMEEVARGTEESNGRAVLAAGSGALMERVFTSSVNLSARGITHLIEELVAVSAAEIAGSGNSDAVTGVRSSASRSGHGGDGPRIFSLQKLVEVADYNMDVRPRISWTRMWDIMGSHLSAIGRHENAGVSMFAIDALRQLSFKFLERPELSDFNFQRVFLKPFSTIMEDPHTREDIRELVLQCADNMIRSRSSNLRSGWRILLSILAVSAADPSARINTLGLAMLQRLLDQHLDELCRVDDNEARNARAEDFVDLCRASLAFVRRGTERPAVPIGLSMRALCHVACYADAIAEGRVAPPEGTAQCEDPDAPGHTYEGLEDGEEAEAMVLWRPILDGLAAGICRTDRSNDGGVGCLVQRGSVMTLRAILFRHGDVFTTDQWAVVFERVILPSFDAAAVGDVSPVTTLSSESPSESSLDFLSDTLPLPPPADDEGLALFAQRTLSEESAPPRRPFGPAELLVEASFADLRHGGDGDLSRAHGLARQDRRFGDRNAHDRPFPDSWISTTAPAAMSMLTDVVGESVLKTGRTGRERLWPTVRRLYRRWILGTSLETGEFDDNDETSSWTACEALVRVGCHELARVPTCLANAASRLEEDEIAAWWDVISRDLADTITANADMEERLRGELAALEKEILTNGDDAERGDGEVGEGDIENDHPITTTTPMEPSESVSASPDESPNNDEDHHIPSPPPLSPSHLDHVVPALKARAIAARLLQRALSTPVTSLSRVLSRDTVEHLVLALDHSRDVARRLGQDPALARAFREAWRREWGADEVESALAALGGDDDDRRDRRGGVETFALAQEADAEAAATHVWATCAATPSLRWADAAERAESVLMERVARVLADFLASEKEDGHLVDWERPSRDRLVSRCRSFEGVVVRALEFLKEHDGFDRRKRELFPLLCAAVRVRSDRVRGLVSDVLRLRVGPLLGIEEEGRRAEEEED